MISLVRLAQITSLLACLLLQASCKETITGDCFKGTPDEVTVACEAQDCCTTLTSCFWQSNTTVTVCPHSCQGDYACDFAVADAAKIVVRTSSCIGDFSCQGFGLGAGALDADNSLEVWDNSCHGLQSCQDSHATIGHDSCYGYRACANVATKIEDETCLTSWSCLPGVGHITTLANYVGRFIAVSLVAILVLFLHPKPPRDRESQQEHVLLNSMEHSD